MGLIDGMKDKLGFSDRPEWLDDYDDGAEASSPEIAGLSSAPDSGSVLDFDAYNPDNFENVTLRSGTTPRVASRESSSYDSLGSPYSAPRSRSTRRTSPASTQAGGWSAPEAPSFLDDTGPGPSAREALSSASSGTSSGTVSGDSPSLGSDFMSMRGDPATHLSIVRPGAYADVEKIANAAKVGKSIVLDVTGTQNDLAKRILDFTFGVASALNLNVDKADERIFVISKGAEMLSTAERDYLRTQGILK